MSYQFNEKGRLSNAEQVTISDWFPAELVSSIGILEGLRIRKSPLMEMSVRGLFYWVKRSGTTLRCQSRSKLFLLVCINSF